MATRMNVEDSVELLVAFYGGPFIRTVVQLHIHLIFLLHFPDNSHIHTYSVLRRYRDPVRAAVRSFFDNSVTPPSLSYRGFLTWKTTPLTNRQVAFNTFTQLRPGY